jgi:hypothetical protein
MMFLADYLVRHSFLANIFRSIGSRVFALCLDRTWNIHIGRGLPNGIEVNGLVKYGRIISESLNDKDL